jgi:hypothetical protein
MCNYYYIAPAARPNWLVREGNTDSNSQKVYGKKKLVSQQTWRPWDVKGPWIREICRHDVDKKVVRRP